MNARGMCSMVEECIYICMELGECKRDVLIVNIDVCICMYVCMYVFDEGGELSEGCFCC